MNLVCVGVPPNVTVLRKWGTERGEEDIEREDGKRDGLQGEGQKEGEQQRRIEREDMKGAAQRRGG